MTKIKDLTPKFKKLPPAEKELLVQYQAGELPFGQNEGGLQMYSRVFKRGYGDNVIGMDENGMWMGAADFSNAKTKFDYEGAGFFKGTVRAGSLVSGNGIGATVGTDPSVDEYTDIQTAIDFVNGLGGGTVFIKSGTYTLTSFITLYSNIELIGEDRENTIIDCNNSTASVRMDGTLSTHLNNIKVSNLQIINSTYIALRMQYIDNFLINGCKFSNNTATFHDISNYMCINGTISNCTSSNSGNFLVVTYPTSVNIINNYVNNCSGIGVEIGLEQINKHGCLVQGNNIITAGSHGIYLNQAEHARIIGNNTVDVGGNGIEIYLGDYNQISGNVLHVNGTTSKNIRIDGDYNNITGNKFRGSGGGSQNNIHVDNGNRNTIVGNNMDSTGAVSVLIDSTCNKTLVLGNYLYQGITDNGVGSIVDHNTTA